MKKILLLLPLFFSLQIACIQAQCEPDPAYANETFGFFPLPDTVNSPTSSLPTAIEGEDYELVFTLAVPDSLLYEFNPGAFDLLGISGISLDSVSGLPVGLAVDNCAPEDCVFPSQSSGCISIAGTPTTVGVYPIVFHTRVQIGFAGVPVQFPGSTFEGEYKIIVEEDVSVEVPINQSITLGQNVPNPFSISTKIDVKTERSGNFDFKVYNLIGKEVYQEVVRLEAGDNTITFEGTHLKSGMYFYSLGRGMDMLTRRMVVYRP